MSLTDINAGDLTDAVRERVTSAFESSTPLAVKSGATKDFLGNPVVGAALQLSAHRGVIDYQPTELVITARAGTPLAELESILAERKQMLPFEPPHFGASATLGGTIAAGLSGPRRPYAGSARDFVLGTRVVNGRGEVLRFGGEVMKNVAGYDISRLMVGALGTLGVLMDVSLKVLPCPAAEQTLVLATTQTEAIAYMNALAGRPLPLSAAYWEAGRLYLRFSGSQQTIKHAHKQVDGDALSDDTFWAQVREQQTPFFADANSLWRLSVPPTAPVLDIDGETALDWGAAQRWLKSPQDADGIRGAVAEAGGHATLFRGTGVPRFHPLAAPLMAAHQRVKQAMDPANILNPGRLYPEL